MLDAKDIIDELRSALGADGPAHEANTLADWVGRCLQEARNDKRAQDVFEDIELGARHGEGRYTSSEKARIAAALGDTGLDVFMPITATKCQALQNWLSDVFRPNSDKPFTLTPSPVPDLPPHMLDAAAERMAQLTESGALTPEEVAAVAGDVRKLVLDYANSQARSAARRMEDKIHDMLLDGRWRETFEAFVVDVSRYPAAIINGPVLERRRRTRWVGDSVIETEDQVLRFRRVDPRRWFPAPGAESMDHAPWVIELREVTRLDLEQARSLPGFVGDNIDYLLSIRDGFSDMEAMEGVHGFTGGPQDSPASTYDVRILTGHVPTWLLKDAGADVNPDAFGLDYTFAEVWVCDGVVLRAVTDPWPGRRKPYYVAGFRPRPGSLWFDSLPRILRDLQRSANAAQRALVFNVGMASGPLVEMLVDDVVNEDEPDRIEPWRIIKVQDNPLRGNAPVVRVHNVASTTPHLIATIQNYSAWADDISGIPAYVAGDPSVQGAGRTLGGLAMLMGNAAKGLKRVVGTIDVMVIEPLVSMMHDLIMLYSSDTSLKADVRVVPKGVSGLLQRELTQAKAMELLQLVLNPAIIQTGVVPPEAVPNLLREVASALGYDPDIVAADPDAQAELVSALQRAGVQVAEGEAALAAEQARSPFGGSEPSGPGGLDGRSQPRVGNQDAQAMADAGLSAATNG